MSVFRLDGLKRSVSESSLENLVSDTEYSTQAALESAFPAADNSGREGLVSTGTAGRPRLFHSTGTLWVPSQVVTWQTASTGAAGERALRTAAGAAIYHGDVGVNGQSLVFYACVDDARRVAWVPQTLPGGIRLGVTHTATVIGICFEEDPNSNSDFTVTASGGAVVDYDTTVAGKIAIRASASNVAKVVFDGTIPADADAYVFGVLGASWTQVSGTQSLYELSHLNSGTVERLLVYAGSGNSPDYEWQQDGVNPVMSAFEFNAEHDGLFVRSDLSGTSRYAYENFPGPAAGDAVPVATDTQAGGNLNTRASTLAEIRAQIDAINPGQWQGDGFFAIACEAV